jgi:hypothetical protein
VLFYESIGLWFSISLDVPEGFSGSIFSVGLQSQCELSSEVGNLIGVGCTNGLEVVLLQKVEPVGMMLGGYLDL